jgi:hypothetical protein
MRDGPSSGAGVGPGEFDRTDASRGVPADGLRSEFPAIVKDGASAAAHRGAQLPALEIYKALLARLDRLQVERKNGEKLRTKKAGVKAGLWGPCVECVPSIYWPCTVMVNGMPVSIDVSPVSVEQVPSTMPSVYVPGAPAT